MRRSAALIGLAFLLIPIAIVIRGNVAAPPGGAAEQINISRQIDQQFTEGRCIVPSEAMSIVDRILHDGGYADRWIIRPLDGAQGSPCNAVAVDGENRWILLSPSSLPAVSTALAELRVAALRECFSRDELTARIIKITEKFGEKRFAIRDGGPITFPVESGTPIDESRDAAKRHFDQGCAMYSGLSWDKDGSTIVLLAGGGS